MGPPLPSSGVEPAQLPNAERYCQGGYNKEVVKQDMVAVIETTITNIWCRWVTRGEVVITIIVARNGSTAQVTSVSVSDAGPSLGVQAAPLYRRNPHASHLEAMSRWSRHPLMSNTHHRAFNIAITSSSTSVWCAGSNICGIGTVIEAAIAQLGGIGINIAVGVITVLQLAQIPIQSRSALSRPPRGGAVMAFNEAVPIIVILIWVRQGCKG